MRTVPLWVLNWKLCSFAFFETTVPSMWRTAAVAGPARAARPIADARTRIAKMDVTRLEFKVSFLS